MPPARRYGSVIFDCDSTLSAIEGIDELAKAQRVALGLPSGLDLIRRVAARP